LHTSEAVRSEGRHFLVLLQRVTNILMSSFGNKYKS